MNVVHWVENLFYSSKLHVFHRSIKLEIVFIETFPISIRVRNCLLHPAEMSCNSQILNKKIFVSIAVILY